MADIEVNVFNQKLKLSYREEEKQRIKNGGLAYLMGGAKK